MDYVFAALLFAHLLGLVLMAAAFLPLLGMMGEGGAAPVTNRLLTRLGHYGIIIAVISGPLLLWVRYGGFDGISHWFWLKMLFLLVLAGGVVTSAMSARKMRQGDAAAARRVRAGRVVSVVALIGIVLSAVLAFG
ncbi:MAG TPA: CopD family protein [Devosia sp.]